MRYPAEQKQETHDRIVRAAVRRFRRHGESNVGIADLMQELKLTHGGFYKHFDSKQALFIETISLAFEESAETIERVVKKARPGTEMKSLIEFYLSGEHCLGPDDGCPVAAFSADMSRQPEAVRKHFDNALRNHGKRFAKYLPGSTENGKLRNFAILFSGMSGALSLARAVSDTAMRTRILEGAKEFYIRSFCS
jgi:TetR/AcrR family transcriptional regulator, transcriptional repressor for nem operon